MKYKKIALIVLIQLGYYANQVSVQVNKNSKIIKEFNPLWGFPVGTDNKLSYFVTVAMDDENRESYIENFRVNVYNMHTWQVIASEFIRATERFENL